MRFHAKSKLTVNAPSPGCFRAVCRGLQVFGALMLLGGVTHFSTPAQYVYDALRMGGWQPAPAVVLKAELRSTAEDENQYAYATYQYQFRGADYKSERIDAAGPIFGALSEQRPMATELQRLQKDRVPTTCYVNPQDPSEAVLYPQLKYSVLGWSLLGPTIFSGFGSLLFVIGGLALRRARRLTAAQAAHPNQPWLWREEWAARLIPTQNYKLTWMLWAVAAIYFLVVLPVGLVSQHQRGGALLSWPTAVYALIGWGLFNACRTAFKASKQWKRALFRLGTDHGLIGGPLVGVIEVPHNTTADTVFRLRLECQETQRDSDGDSVQSNVWHDQTKVQPTSSSERSGTTIIPVYFAIPFTCQPTDESVGQRIRWRLIVDEGSDMSPRGVFEVPVFKTAASSRTYQEDRSVLEPYQPVHDLEQTISQRCRIEPLPGGGEELRFSILQPLMLLCGMVLIGLCTAGITALLYFEFHPAWTIMPAIFTAMIVAGTLDMLLWGSRLEIRPEEMRIRAGILGFRKVRSVPRETFVEHTTIECMKEWKGQETTDWHSIRLVLVLPNPKFDETQLDPEDEDFDLNGEMRLLPSERLVVAKRIDSRPTAERLAEWLGEKLGLAKLVCSAEFQALRSDAACSNLLIKPTNC